MKVESYSTTRRLISQRPAILSQWAGETINSLDGYASISNILRGGLRLQGKYKFDDNNSPLITVITVVYNGVGCIEETIKSVLEQSYDNVEYIVVDGGSTDGTIDLIRRYEGSIDYWVSESDRGLYDGLAKGFSAASGSIICYLNAGDLYVKTALEAVASIFRDTGVKWITGLRSVCSESNQVIKVDTPFRYKAELIRRGVYGRYLPYIQQESTFWSRELLRKVDMTFFRSLRLAGDYYLWCCFSDGEELTCAQVQLGIFKRHDGQLSESLDKYWMEVKKFATRPSVWIFLEVIYESLFWLVDERVRKFSRARKIHSSTVNGKSRWIL